MNVIYLENLEMRMNPEIIVVLVTLVVVKSFEVNEESSNGKI